ncbi:unnamed protein product [Tuber melanosporum]|uniref:(Perigord truffle) hypothetical protein n=1 Tax=Tuber melanosporum (strain Mel28) TaxID=656061 RepID=D5GPE6_TUBMM|nr:uncharacterized protein GSTUM_00011696001 [Tuber melanosporum]CAZ86308.1 unnamed protein product [Tuber melanosporum]
MLFSFLFRPSCTSSGNLLLVFDLACVTLRRGGAFHSSLPLMKVASFGVFFVLKPLVGGFASIPFHVLKLSLVRLLSVLLTSISIYYPDSYYDRYGCSTGTV